jgi:molecular chaperone HtpG
LRKHNIQVGNADFLNEYFKEPRGNNYFYGEIHILNPKIKLNSARDGLAPTPEGERLRVVLRNKFEELYNLYHLASKAKLLAENKNGLPQESVLDEIEKKRKSKNAQNAGAKQILDHYKKKASEGTDRGIGQGVGVSGHDGNSARIGGLRGSQDVKIEDDTEEKEDIETATFEIHEGGVDEQVSHERDLTDVLRGKMTPGEVDVVKRVLSIMTENCPKESLRLLEQLKKVVINQLA